MHPIKEPKKNSEMTKKNCFIKIRIDSDSKEKIVRAIEKIKELSGIEITQTIFVRSAIINYIDNVLAGKFKLQVERK